MTPSKCVDLLKLSQFTMLIEKLFVLMEKLLPNSPMNQLKKTLKMKKLKKNLLMMDKYVSMKENMLVVTLEVISEDYSNRIIGDLGSPLIPVSDSVKMMVTIMPI